jgi:nitrite reductase (NADH) small subunit
MQSNSQLRWMEVCDVNDIVPDSGVCALLDGQQVALFRLASTDEIFALSNYDPFSEAQVLSRGIVGDKNGVPKVVSPIYKQSFNLGTGECLDDPHLCIPAFPTRVENGRISVALPVEMAAVA